ncbi:MAG: hypothetical protein H8E40_01355 [Chloroflexi bacterium]|nr:hypothetical protein [Chloroflexota bacterium]
MKFYSMITYSDPKAPQVEMLTNADDYHQAGEIFLARCYEEPKSIRIRVLGVVDEEIPVEVYIEKVKK